MYVEKIKKHNKYFEHMEKDVSAKLGDDHLVSFPGFHGT